MRYLRKLCLLCTAACAVIWPASASAQAPTPRQIAEAYDAQMRHPTLAVRFKLNTCRYRIEQSQMRCVEQPRERVVENVLKSYGRDIRSVGILSEPASDRGIGLLGFEYWEKSKVNDYWIYLPALNKVKRVVSSKDKDSGSYFGTEFYIEDLEEPRLDEYTYKLLGEESLQVQEVDKKRFVLLKSEHYALDGSLFKRRTVRNLELIDGKWLPRQTTMDNLADRRVTVMDRQAVAVGLNVDDEYFAQRVLTDEVFRERYLSKFRNHWKQ